MMTTASKALFIVSALALTACNTPRGTAGTDGPSATACLGGLYDAGLGDPCDPGSIAYFNRTFGNQVLFEVGQSALTAEGRAILAGQAQWLTTNTGYAAIVEGHADEPGTREDNLTLGEHRAVTVQSFLISQGVSAERLRTISYGKERPIEMCSVEACYAKNRRAMTVLSAGAGA